ncbi:MAG: ABC transporter permease [Oligoflexales bacterium]
MNLFSIPAIHTSKINWQNRKVILDLTLRDFRLRYVGSMLGRYWNLINPLAMITIYTIIFSKVMGARLGNITNPYAYTVYLCAGLLPWNALAELISRGTNVFLEHAYLIKKVSFPKELLPAVVVGSTSVNFLISFALLFGLILVTGHQLSFVIAGVAVVFFLQLIFLFGLICFLGTLNVFFRDIQQAVSIVLQIWFWLTPVVYLESAVPERFVSLLRINPFYYFVTAYHDLIFWSRWPTSSTLATCAGISVFFFVLGTSFFAKFKDQIADEI